MDTTSHGSDFRRDVRIPELLLEQLSRGEITLPMLLTMTYLYKWADWRTGEVAYASAGGLETVTGGAYSGRTYQDAMKRLQTMGWITRHMIHGSKNSFPITIHNYKSTDESGDVTILNSRQINAAVKRRGRPRKNKDSYAPQQENSCAEAAHAGRG